jgi:hypothetical protein
MIAMSNDAPTAQPVRPEEDFSLLDLLVFLYRNRMWALAGSAVFAILAYFWFETGEILYEATSTCLVVENNSKQQTLNTQLCQRLAESAKIANQVSDKLKEKNLLNSKKPVIAGTIRAKIQDGRALTLTAAADTPVLAAAIANEAALALAETSRLLKTEMIDSAQSGYARELPNLQKQLQTAESRRSEVAAEYSKKMQTLYQNWRTESSKADEAALATAAILQKETMELLQAYQADTFQKVHALEESLKIEYLRTQVAALNGRTSAARMPREGYNATYAAGHPTTLAPKAASSTTPAPSTWPKTKTSQNKASSGQDAEAKAKPTVAVIDDSELQNVTGDYIASLATDLNTLKPEAAFEPVPLDNLARNDLAKAVSDLSQAETALRKLQSERELGFIKLRQERAAKLERLKQDTQLRQRDLLFARDQELAGLRFAQESADELSLAELTTRREFLNEMAKVNNAATIAKAENGSSDVQIIDVAVPPLLPQQKQSFKFALAGLVLGAFLGYSIAGVREISKISKKRSA